jgi:hypothetical protein
MILNRIGQMRISRNKLYQDDYALIDYNIDIQILNPLAINPEQRHHDL